MAFAPDGKRIALIERDGTLRLMDTGGGKEVWNVPTQPSDTTWLTFSPDGKLVACPCREGEVRLWDAATGKERPRLEGHKGKATAVCLSADGKLLASCGVDHTLRLWDVATGKELRRWTGHAADILGVSLSPDGKVLASASEDRTVRLWEAATGKELAQSTGPGPVRCAALSADGKLLATGHLEDDIYLWDAATGKGLPRPIAFPGPVEGDALSPTAELVAAANRSTDLAVWNTATGKVRFVSKKENRSRPRPGLTGLVFVPNGKEQAVTYGGSAADATVFDAMTGKELRPLLTSQPPEEAKDPPPAGAFEFVIPSDRYAQAFAAGGPLFVTKLPGKELIVWEAATGKPLRRFRAPPAQGLAVAADGRSVLTMSSFSTAQLWEIATGWERFGNRPPVLPLFPVMHQGRIGSGSSKDRWREPPPEEPPPPLALSADGRLVAEGVATGSIRIWDTLSRQLLRTFAGSGVRISELTFAADGKLMSVTADGIVLIWDTAKLRWCPRRVESFCRPGPLTFWNPFLSLSQDPSFGRPQPLLLSQPRLPRLRPSRCRQPLRLHALR
jgi:WD40 repeat protein